MIAALLLAAAASSPQAWSASADVVIDASAARAGTLRQTLESLAHALDRRGPGSVTLWMAGGVAGAKAPRGTCSSVQALTGASAASAREAAAHWRASGPLPLAAALKKAAAVARTEGVRRAIIVVAGGPDGCGANACAARAELERKRLADAVTVVAPPGAAAALQCLGDVVTADSRQLPQALRAALDAALVPAELEATAVEDGRPVAARIEVVTPTGAAVAQGRTGERLRVPAGRYDVHAVRSASGPLREGWRRGIDFTPGTLLPLRVGLGDEPGRLLVRVRFNGGEAPGGTRIFVFAPGARDEALAAGWPGDELALPAGRYDVRASVPASALGEVDLWRAGVEVEAGAAGEVLLAGAVKLGALRVKVRSGDDALDDAAVMVLPNRSRLANERTLALDEPVPLPAGLYTVAVRLETPGGTLSAFRDDVRVSPDAPVDLSVDVGPTALLTVQVTGADADDGLAAALLRPGQIEADLFFDPLAPVRVPAGRYDLRLERTWPRPHAWFVHDLVLRPGERRVVLTKAP